MVLYLHLFCLSIMLLLLQKQNILRPTNKAKTWTNLCKSHPSSQKSSKIPLSIKCLLDSWNQEYTPYSYLENMYECTVKNNKLKFSTDIHVRSILLECCKNCMITWLPSILSFSYSVCRISSQLWGHYWNNDADYRVLHLPDRGLKVWPVNRWVFPASRHLIPPIVLSSLFIEDKWLWI
jgi:hypothetical protein